MLDWREVLIRLLLASLLGSLIGLERERKNWSAGMRTHMMVCVGSCLIMIVSSFGFREVLGGDVVLDPSRVAAQVVSGIGFIGAGTILFQKQGTIRGLTTASGLWTVAAIGLATGTGMYVAASITTVLAFLILWALQPFEKRYARRFRKQTLKIITSPRLEDVDIVHNILDVDYFTIETFNITKLPTEYIFNVVFETADGKRMSELLKELRSQDAIKEVFWGH